jgi:hypothetical protein
MALPDAEHGGIIEVEKTCERFVSDMDGERGA